MEEGDHTWNDYLSDMIVMHRFVFVENYLCQKGKVK